MFFYAAAGALEHISKVFNAAVSLPARKSDLKPKSSDSLRSLRKKLDIPGVGPLFKTKEALKVLEATSCNALNCDISSFEQFQSVIETAINNNLPLLIPYSTDMLNVTPQSIHGHWALIFGCDFNKRQKKIFIATNEHYWGVNAQLLFNGLFNMESNFPSHYFFKRKKGEEWEMNHSLPTNENIYKMDLVPETSLEDFRRKLIIVLPNSFDSEKIQQLGILGASYNNREQRSC